MNLTGTVLTVTIETLGFIAVGAAMQIAGVASVPLSDGVAAVLIAVLFTVNIVGTVTAIIGKPLASPRLPNLTQTVRSRVFPAPATYRYMARTQRGRP